MLVISRRTGEEVHIGAATVKVVQNRAGTVRLGIEAPKQIPIRRGELPPRPPKNGFRADMTFSQLCEELQRPGLRDDNQRLNELLWVAVENLARCYQLFADKAYCVGCLEIFDRSEVVDHIKTCPKHPMNGGK